MLEHLFERSDGLDILRAAIAGVSLLLALVYLRFVDTPASLIRTAIKTATVGVLAALPLTYVALEGADAIELAILVVALALSALGDFFLALKDQQRYFVAGLASFFLAHVAYVAAFAPQTEIPTGWTLAALIGVLISAGALLVVLEPRLGKMREPVVAYFSIIMVMVATAFAIPEASWILPAGATLFALSDSLIAVRKFLAPFPGINIAIWATYCAAQYMITTALLLLAVPALG